MPNKNKLPLTGANKLFDITLQGTVKIDWEMPKGGIISKPLELTEAELKMMGWDEDDVLAEQITDRDCSLDMKCYQRLIREKFDRGEGVEQGELLPEEFSLELKDSVLKPITRDVAKEFIEKYEWLGKIGVMKFAYGLYFPYKSGIGGKLGGVACFSPTTTWQASVSICGEKYKDKVILLSRGACANWCKINTNSYLISEVLKAVERDTEYRIVLAYSDRRAGEVGTVYQATNWLFIGLGATGTDHVPLGLVNPADMRFHTRGLPKELKSKASLLKAGYEVLDVKRANKCRYITFVGSRKERKELMSALRWKSIEYPKREDFMKPGWQKKFRAIPKRM